jgi:hypothetical protein
VTIVHKIHYSIEVPKTKQKRIIGFQNIIVFFFIILWVLRWRVLLLLLWLRWWWWRSHGRGLITTWLYWGIVGHHHLGKVCYRKWRHRKWCDQKWCQSRDRKWRDRKWLHNRMWRHIPSVFSYYSSSTKCLNP